MPARHEGHVLPDAHGGAEARGPRTKPAMTPWRRVLGAPSRGRQAAHRATPASRPSGSGDGRQEAPSPSSMGRSTHETRGGLGMRATAGRPQETADSPRKSFGVLGIGGGGQLLPTSQPVPGQSAGQHQHRGPLGDPAPPRGARCTTRIANASAAAASNVQRARKPQRGPSHAVRLEGHSEAPGGPPVVNQGIATPTAREGPTGRRHPYPPWTHDGVREPAGKQGGRHQRAGHPPAVIEGRARPATG